MNTESITLDEALVWIAGLFGKPVEQITPQTQREEIPDWDSLGDLTVMADLDEKFQILLSDSDLQSMNTVGDLLDCLRKNGNLSN